MGPSGQSAGPNRGEKFFVSNPWTRITHGNRTEVKCGDELYMRRLKCLAFFYLFQIFNFDIKCTFIERMGSQLCWCDGGNDPINYRYWTSNSKY